MNLDNGNAFNQREVKFRPARKIWREIRRVYPGGGTISNVADFVHLGKVPSGTPVKFDGASGTITAYTDAQIASASDPKTLGINGLLQEDTPIRDTTTIGTGTVVYEGEIYEYMLAAATVTALKTVGLPMIVFVQ